MRKRDKKTERWKKQRDRVTEQQRDKKFSKVSKIPDRKENILRI
jgi:hypothetical protein